MTEKVVKTEEEWRELLTAEQFHICREKGTEPAFSGEYDGSKRAGTYRCVGCGAELFASEAKFDSGTGWPSFYAPVSSEAIGAQPDDSLGMRRNEVTCSRCDAHLGHVFEDGPQPTGLRYCINSLALNLVETDK